MSVVDAAGLGNRIAGAIDAVDTAIGKVMGECALPDSADESAVVPMPAGAATCSIVISRRM